MPMNTQQHQAVDTWRLKLAEAIELETVISPEDGIIRIMACMEILSAAIAAYHLSTRETVMEALVAAKDKMPLHAKQLEKMIEMIILGVIVE